MVVIPPLPGSGIGSIRHPRAPLAGRRRCAIPLRHSPEIRSMRLRFAAILPTCVLLATATPALAAPIHQYGGLALAPKGDVIATIEEGNAGHEVIALRSARTGKVLRTVATIGGIAQTPRWSPDGKRIALLVTIGAAKESGATQAGVRQVGEIGEHSDEQRRAVFDAAGAPVAAAAVRPVSPADRYVYEYDWTPDGRGFVATTALGNGDNNWWVATLDAIDATPGDVRTIARPHTPLNTPRVTADGRSVNFIGELMIDFGSIGGDLWSVPFAGGEPVDVTKGAPYSVTSLARAGTMIRGVVLRGDSAGVLTEGKSGAMVGWSRPSSFAAGDGRAAFSGDGRSVAMVVQDFTPAPAIFAGPVSAPVQITHDNDAAPATVAARSITWKNDGFDVQGWLLAPIGADPAVKHPMVTIVHGGPAAANVPSYIQRGASTDLLAAGYYVFLPNPRGSYGQGEAFTAANKRDFGGGDLRDILTGIDAVEKVAPVDDARLGLTGGSYGGFMSMWANTQTNRFKALVAGAGLSNWISYYGTNGIDQW